MTSCRSNVQRNMKKYAGAMLVQVMQIRAGLWCGNSVCSQLSLVHMIGRGSKPRLFHAYSTPIPYESSPFKSTIKLSPPLIYLD